MKQLIALPIFPPHKCGLFLSHNEHKDYSESVQNRITDLELENDFPNPEEMANAILRNELWVLQWYPESPTSFCRVAASTLEGLLEAAECQK